MTPPSTAGTTAAPTESSGAKADAKAAAADLKASAADAARDLKDDAADAAEQRARRGKRAATGALDDVADALHAGADDLRDHDRDRFAHYADVAADQVEQFVGSVRDRSVGELLDEAERFARRDPGLFIGGAFLLGVFGARFLKASSPDRFDRRSGGSGFGRRTDDPYRYRAEYGAHSAGARDSGRTGDYGRSGYGEAAYRPRGTAGALGGGRIAAPSGVTGGSGRTGAGGALAGAPGTGGTISEGAGTGVSRSATDDPTGL